MHTTDHIVEGVELVTPIDPRYDELRLSWNLAADQRPAAVALPATADEVAAVVRHARERGLRVAPQGTGHNAAPMGDLGDTVLLKTTKMRGVEIDAAARWARVEAGVLWAEVTAPASEHGLAPLAGSSPDVGVVGYTLGGGMSWLGRKYGLASNSVLAIEMVTADGELIRADAENHTDLFWAVRGGGGSFAVVTAIEFLLYPATDLTAGMMIWPLEDARKVLRGWREWTRTAPDSATTSFRIMHVPPLEEIPEFVRGRSIVVVDGAVLAGEAEAARILEPLRALTPEIDMFGPMPPAGLSYIHMDPEEPMPGISDHLMLGDLDEAGMDAFVAAGAPGGSLLMLELRQLGGALGRAPADAGAIGAFDGTFAAFAAGLPMVPEMVPAIHTELAAWRAALSRCQHGRVYLNFAEAPTAAVDMFGEHTTERLRAIKAQVDPENRIRANHPIDR